MRKHGLDRTPVAHLYTGLFVVMLTVVPQSVRAGSFECLIDPTQEVEIRSPVDGLIDKIHVQRGDNVKKGQTLVELDASVERSSMETAKYRTQMGGLIATARNRLEFATKKFERLDGLSKKNYVAAQARDEAETEKRLAESGLQDAIESQQLARLEYRHGIDIVNLRILHSPFDGVVVDRSLNPGDLSQSGNGKKPILKLAQIDPLKVEVVLPLEVYGRIKIGMAGVVTPERIGGSYPASVKVVDRVIDAASGTFGVRLEMPNRRNGIPGGIRCQVEFADLKSMAVKRDKDRISPASLQKGHAQ
jgi:RND family efflux transporter MFP subunit